MLALDDLMRCWLHRSESRPPGRKIAHCDPPVALFKSPAKQFPAHEIVIHSDEHGEPFSQKLHSNGWTDACAEDPRHCFEGNTEPLCVVNPMVWKSRKRRRHQGSNSRR
jgi:hypothetical protein